MTESLAAAQHSKHAPVAARSFFATLQSAGAGGRHLPKVVTFVRAGTAAMGSIPRAARIAYNRVKPSGGSEEPKAEGLKEKEPKEEGEDGTATMRAGGEKDILQDPKTEDESVPETEDPTHTDIGESETEEEGRSSEGGKQVRGEKDGDFGKPKL